MLPKTATLLVGTPKFRKHSDAASCAGASQRGHYAASGYLFRDAFESEDLLSEEDDPGDDVDVAEELLSGLLACPEVDFRA